MLALLLATSLLSVGTVALWWGLSTSPCLRAGVVFGFFSHVFLSGLDPLRLFFFQRPGGGGGGRTMVPGGVKGKWTRPPSKNFC